MPGTGAHEEPARQSFFDFMRKSLGFGGAGGKGAALMQSALLGWVTGAYPGSKAFN